MILGTVFWDWEMNIEDEINIYNKLIIHISKNLKIDYKNILYKPHPRCQNLNLKKDKLLCSILSGKINLLVEEYLIKLNVISLYSFGSTSLIYGKNMFNINSFIIDATKFKSNKNHYDYSKLRKDEFDTYKKFGVNKIIID